MRIDDFARPEQMVRWAGKLFVGILALLLLPTLVQALVRALPGFALVVGLAMASFIAYAARERAGGGSRQTQQTGGSERTPVLPTIEEEF